MSTPGLVGRSTGLKRSTLLSRIWIKRDDADNRLSPAWRLNQARVVAHTEGMKAALSLIEKAYNDDSNLQNAYSQIAWEVFMPRDMAYEKIIPYLEQDLKLGRLKGNWELVYAQTLALVGRRDEAEHRLVSAYINDTTLKNGFAQIGYSSHFLFNYEPEKALQWIIRDERKGRLHGEFIFHKATLLAAMGDIESAASIIDEIYQRDSKAVNGYAIIGWHGYMVKKQDPEKALLMVKQDQQLKRINKNALNLLGNSGNLLAGIYACLGKRQKSEQCLPLFGENGSRIVGGHAIVGFCDYHRNRDLLYVRSMLDKEKGSGDFARPFLSYLYAAVLLRLGKKKRAECFIRDAAKRSNLSAIFAKSWLKRVGYSKEKMKSEFIRPELEEMFVRMCKV